MKEIIENHIDKEDDVINESIEALMKNQFDLVVKWQRTNLSA